MDILYNRQELGRRREEWKSKGLRIGFVPTMGALHQGHISLVKLSKERCDVTIVSIFVNPTQFNDPNDFLKYPSTLDADLEMLLEAACDAVFVPTVEMMYPDGPAAHKIELDLGYLGTCMEGEKRPGHFDGVVQVVHLLLDIVRPDVLFLGEKDIQQVKVITRLRDAFHLPIEIMTGPTLREGDGLAMSSRNMRLTSEDRMKAPALFKALNDIKEQYGLAEPTVLTKSYIEELNQIPGIRVEYLEIVDSQTLIPLKKWNKKGSNLACIAAWVGDIRLIDNALF